MWKRLEHSDAKITGPAVLTVAININAALRHQRNRFDIKGRVRKKVTGRPPAISGELRTVSSGHRIEWKPTTLEGKLYDYQRNQSQRECSWIRLPAKHEESDGVGSNENENENRNKNRAARSKTSTSIAADRRRPRGWPRDRPASAPPSCRWLCRRRQSSLFRPPAAGSRRRAARPLAAVWTVAIRSPRRWRPRPATDSEPSRTVCDRRRRPVRGAVANRFSQDRCQPGFS